MLIIGLTGGIATGKSTVSSLLKSQHNLPIIDADVLARAVVLPNEPAYNAIIAYFGPTTPDLLYSPPSTDPFPHPSGLPNINRAVLGRRVFGNDPQRKKDRDALNAIVHPAVRNAMLKGVLSWYLRGAWAVILDVPLLFEGGLDLMCGTTLVIGVSNPDIQLQRLMARDAHLTEEDARHRVGSQMGIAEKVERADAVIWNDGGKEELAKQVNAFVRRCKSGRGPWWTWFLVGCWPVAMWLAAWRFVGAYLRRKRYLAGKSQTSSSAGKPSKAKI